MTTTRPQIDPNGLYESAAACKALGVSRQYLSSKARSGQIAYKVRRSNGRRIYKGSDLMKLWLWVY